MGFAGREGLLPAILITLLPFVILAVLLRILPPWEGSHHAALGGADVEPAVGD
jgi:hypothetical protein